MEKRDNEIFMQSPDRQYLTPPVSMRGSVPHYIVRKKGGCIGRKQESIFKSEEWDVHFV